MSEFTKSPLSEQRFPDSAIDGGLQVDDIARYVQRGKQLHSRAIRGALFAGFCSIGKAADRASAVTGQTFRRTDHKAGHSPS